VELLNGAWPLPLALFVTGLASGVHCIGMCGGVVSAFAAARAAVSPSGSMIPIRAAPRPDWARQLALNAGRVTSYAAGGAIAGTLGGAGALLAGAMSAQAVLYVLANVMLVLAGLYLAGAGRLLGRLESLGAPLWRRLQPLAARLMSAPGLRGSYAAGLVWGWLPCGLVYGALFAAALAGSPLRGALAMLGFGLGTLPTLLGAGIAAGSLRAWARRRAVRIAAGGLIAGFGAWGLAHASGLFESIRTGLLCL
jgi:sulfite exporter TauE/SafE